MGKRAVSRHTFSAYFPLLYAFCALFSETKSRLGTPAIKQASRIFRFYPFRVVFSETNAKALLTTCGHQKRFALFVLFSVNGNFDNLPIVARHKAFVDMVNNKLIIDLFILNGMIET